MSRTGEIQLSVIREPDGYVEIDPDESLTWHRSRGCGRIRWQKSVVGPVKYLERKLVVDPPAIWVDSCECAEGQVSFASDSRSSVRTVSGGLPTLGKRRR